MPKMSRKAMIAFLSGHFRYDTMNSWNAATSYAVRVKMRDLEFPSKEVRDRAYELLDIDHIHDHCGVTSVLEEFDESHRWEWQMGFNGRSGGYLVLYQGGREPSGYKSHCLSCGGRNYQPVGDKNRKCGRCRTGDLVDDKTVHMRTITWPGRGVDMGEDFEEWDTDSLRDRVALVKEFDRACAEACETFIEYARDHTVESRTILVEREVQVLVRVDGGSDEDE
jgi:hypothetical protein